MIQVKLSARQPQPLTILPHRFPAAERIMTHGHWIKDAPAFRRIQQIGDIAAYPILGGRLHHDLRSHLVFATHSGLNRLR
jgi:hypothetical protein